MKYMTPERHQAFQTDDDDLADRTMLDWEVALDNYDKRLAEIDQLCQGDPTWAKIRTFQKTCCLHDADYDRYWHPSERSGSWNQLVIHQRFSTSSALCILRYKLSLPGFVDQEPLISSKVHELPMYARCNKLAQEDETYCVSWLYDEFDLFSPGEPVCEPYYISQKEYTSKPATYSHNILFSTGHEFRFLFTDFRFLYAPLGFGVVEA